MKTATILGPDGEPMEATVYAYGSGLAVTWDGKRWTVTHLGSGKAIYIGAFWARPDDVQRAMAAAVALPIDWTQDDQALYALRTSDPALLKRLAWAMRLAADPPKRARYRDQHARMKPYKAQTRRTAIHEAHEVGVPSLHSDFWGYKWREGFWEAGMIRPMRQPCKRFTARKAAERGVAAREARRAAERAERERHNAAVRAAREQVPA